MSPLLLDCDGVLADFHAAWFDTAQGVTSKLYTEEDVTSWDLVESLGLSKEDASEIDRLVKQPGWCYHIPPVESAISRFGGLQERIRRPIHIVTSPYPGAREWEAERREWLKKYFGIDRKDVTFTNRKDLIKGVALVDDGAHNVWPWAQANFLFPSFLIDKPWNRSLNISENWKGRGAIYRIKNLDGVNL